MEARVARLKEMIPVHQERCRKAKAKAAKALASIDDPTNSMIEQCNLARRHDDELRRAKTEERVCEWYEYCIKRWTEA